jgi:hypothetical protein
MAAAKRRVSDLLRSRNQPKLVGQVVNLRPIVNRPSCSAVPPTRWMSSCPTTAHAGLSLVGRTPWSAAGALVGLFRPALEAARVAALLRCPQDQILQCKVRISRRSNIVTVVRAFQPARNHGRAAIGRQDRLRCLRQIRTKARLWSQFNRRRPPAPQPGRPAPRLPETGWLVPGRHRCTCWSLHPRRSPPTF